MPAGRPSIYSQELCDEICTRTANSAKSLNTICKELEISVSNVRKWLLDADKKEFADKYARAKEEQADFLAEEILEIADDDSNDYLTDDEGNEKLNQEFVQRSKLRIEARKWVAAKLKPKKYSDRTNIDHTTDGEKINQGIDISKLDTATIEAILKATNDGPVEG